MQIFCTTSSQRRQVKEIGDLDDDLTGLPVKKLDDLDHDRSDLPVKGLDDLDHDLSVRGVRCVCVSNHVVEFGWLGFLVVVFPV